MLYKWVNSTIIKGMSLTAACWQLGPVDTTLDIMLNKSILFFFAEKSVQTIWQKHRMTNAKNACWFKMLFIAHNNDNKIKRKTFLSWLKIPQRQWSFVYFFDTIYDFISAICRFSTWATFNGDKNKVRHVNKTS